MEQFWHHARRQIKKVEIGIRVDGSRLQGVPDLPSAADDLLVRLVLKVRTWAHGKRNAWFQ